MKILVVEDDTSIREMLMLLLQKNGYEVDIASNASTATTLLERNLPDLLLLDWMLPDVSGIELLKKLRKLDFYVDLPVIMLTAKVDEKDKLKGFESGVDDYIVKPFSYKELLARIQAVLKRSKTSHIDDVCKVGDLELLISSQHVSAEGKILKLGPTEYKLLVFFVENNGRVLSRSQLIDNVWGINSYVEERAVDVSVRRLRKALSNTSCEEYITTIYGAGYCFKVEK